MRRDYDAARARRKEFCALLAQRYCSADLAVHELVFGELVANAVRYGDDPISAGVTLSNDGIVEIRVENAGNCFDLDRLLEQSPASTTTGGRGLHIVRALVDTLTVEYLPVHTCRVTATLKISKTFPSADDRAT
jgi:anti-sigma regulatory factor (Ser/Thr protein kinase)